MKNSYDIIVVGGGHAGCEAALASSRMGLKTLMLTINIDTIAHMSCAPSVGGTAKGHLVRELDALGGEMGWVTDQSALQFQTLNRSKGAAIWSTRVQVDKNRYKSIMGSILERQRNLDIKQALIEEIIADGRVAVGVKDQFGNVFYGKAIVLAPGTFLNGVIHIGLKSFPSGRAGEFSSKRLSENFKELGFEMGRFKTGTGPRLKGSTIDYSKMEERWGDKNPRPFSHRTVRLEFRELPCYITYTTPETHEIIMKNLDKSALYSGQIKATPVRYCPSLEDKVVKFSDRDRHRVILEPEGVDTDEIYVSGLGNSMPFELQYEIVRSVPGLEKAEIMRPGYAIEHDIVFPHQLHPTLETKIIENLFLAGQINGTTGYEEAASQGFWAGVNASLKVEGKGPFLLDRSEAYMAVMVDDLVTKGTNEPYRMFTSRAEYRLLLREDNADMRLMERGYELGLITYEAVERMREKRRRIEEEVERLKHLKIYPEGWINEELDALGEAPIDDVTTCYHLLKRPKVEYQTVMRLSGEEAIDDPEVIRGVEIDIKYDGYIRRQMQEVEKFRRLESIKVPYDFDYGAVQGLSNELREKLERIRPISLGQASRIPGMTPAALSILMIMLEREQKKNRKKGEEDAD